MEQGREAERQREKEKDGGEKEGKDRVKMKITPQLYTQSLVEANTHTLQAGGQGRLLNLQVATRETVCVCVLVPISLRETRGID